MKNNLIPERRTDRNGKTVTRWVKPSTQQNTQNFPPPAAEQSHLATYPQLFQEFRNALKNTDLSIPEDIDYTMVRTGLQNLPPHTLSYLDSLITNNDDNDYLICMVISGIHKGTPASVIDDSVYLYTNMNRNYFNFDSCSYWTGFDGLNIATSSLRGCGLNNIEGLDYAYGSDKPMRLQGNQTADKVLAIFNTISAMSELGKDNEAIIIDKEERSERLRDPALANLIVQHYEHNAELLEAIEERDTLDPDTLRLILDNDAAALSSGVL